MACTLFNYLIMLYNNQNFILKDGIVSLDIIREFKS